MLVVAYPLASEVDWWTITPPINIIFDRRKNWKEKKQSSPGRAITCRLSFAVMPKPTSYLPPSLTHHLEATHEKKRSCGVLKNNGKKWKFKAHTYALIDYTISYSHQDKMDKILNFLAVYSTHPKLYCTLLQIIHSFIHSKFLLIFKIQFHQYEMLRYGVKETDLTKAPDPQWSLTMLQCLACGWLSKYVLSTGWA